MVGTSLGREALHTTGRFGIPKAASICLVSGIQICHKRNPSFLPGIPHPNAGFPINPAFKFALL
jgi:hypothetical protein